MNRASNGLNNCVLYWWRFRWDVDVQKIKLNLALKLKNCNPKLAEMYVVKRINKK